MAEWRMVPHSSARGITFHPTNWPRAWRTSQGCLKVEASRSMGTVGTVGGGGATVAQTRHLITEGANTTYRSRIILVHRSNSWRLARDWACFMIRGRCPLPTVGAHSFELVRVGTSRCDPGAYRHLISAARPTFLRSQTGYESDPAVAPIQKLIKRSRI